MGWGSDNLGVWPRDAVAADLLCHRLDCGNA